MEQLPERENLEDLEAILAELDKKIDEINSRILSPNRKNSVNIHNLTMLREQLGFEKGKILLKIREKQAEIRSERTNRKLT